MVKVNNENNPSNDYTAGQASGCGNSAYLSQSIQARALFDIYSQNSFITERSCNKLNFKTLKGPLHTTIF